jgi:hypothetical protein
MELTVEGGFDFSPAKKKRITMSASLQSPDGRVHLYPVVPVPDLPVRKLICEPFEATAELLELLRFDIHCALALQY